MLPATPPRVVLLSLLRAGDPGFWRLQPLAQQLLSESERREFGRVRSAAVRGRRIVCRAWLRLLLGESLGTEPSRVVLERGVPGRRELARGPRGVFTVSPSDGAIAVAVLRPPWTGAGWRIGVDIETPRRPRTADLADALYSAAEQAWLDGLPAADREAGFLLLWTLREAVLKADGRGLATDLRLIRPHPPAVSLPLPRDGIHLPLAESALVDPPRWCCWVRQDGAALTALAAQAPGRCGLLSVDLEQVDEATAIARMQAALPACMPLSA